MGYQYIEILYIGKNFYEKKMQRLEFVNVKLFDSLMKVICDLCIYRKVNVFDYGGVVFWRYVYSSRCSIRLMIIVIKKVGGFKILQL